MANEQNEGDSVQFLLSDFNTRLRDIEERNRLIKERVLLLGQNLIDSKQKDDAEITILKKETFVLKKEFEKIKSTLNSLITESNKFVKKDEMAIIERMLKDFQPLEFMRKQDVEELIEKRLNKQNIKTTKTTN